MSSQPKIIPPPDLLLAPTLASFSVDPAVPEPVRAMVEQSISQSGSRLLAPVRFCNLDQAAKVVGRAAAFFDGQLKPSLAPLLRRAHPVLLCATRENGLPSEWELKTLLSILSGRTAGPSSVSWRRTAVHSLSELERASET